MCLSLQAYYTYDDKSCKFSCQAIEYWWWSTAAYTGLIKNRSVFTYLLTYLLTGLIKNRSAVKKEFKYYLPEEFKAKDPKMYALITVSQSLSKVLC